MQAGKLRSTITIKKPKDSDEFGATSNEWETVISCRASITPTTSVEKSQNNDKSIGSTTYSIVTRYLSDVKPSYMIGWNEKNVQILGVFSNERKTQTTITAIEVI